MNAVDTDIKNNWRDHIKELENKCRLERSSAIMSYTSKWPLESDKFYKFNSVNAQNNPYFYIGRFKGFKYTDNLISVRFSAWMIHFDHSYMLYDDNLCLPVISVDDLLNNNFDESVLNSFIEVSVQEYKDTIKKYADEINNKITD